MAFIYIIQAGLDGPYKIVSFTQIFMNCAEDMLEEEKFNEIIIAARVKFEVIK